MLGSCNFGKFKLRVHTHTKVRLAHSLDFPAECMPPSSFQHTWGRGGPLWGAQGLRPGWPEATSKARVSEEKRGLECQLATTLILTTCLTTSKPGVHGLHFTALILVTGHLVNKSSFLPRVPWGLCLGLQIGRKCPASPAGLSPQGKEDSQSLAQKLGANVFSLRLIPPAFPHR